jgi:putative nucleotidyltransferase with HDIG domain
MKKNVLFVDDEANLILGLKRSLRGMAGEWNLFFATSGQEALELLSQNHIDIIVTDMRMPGMDGSELLAIVSNRYPQVIRFVLSGQSDQEMSLKSTQVAHQFIAKPCDILKLQQAIQHSLHLRDLLNDPKLLGVITGIQKLPSLPALYIKLLQAMDDPTVSIKTIGNIIAQDITMTAKVLQLVNSAFYGLPTKVTNPQRAAVILGINTLKALALSQHVFAEYRGKSTPFFTIDKLWEHSLSVGNLARSLARSSATDAQVLDESQVAGLMHDIGKLIQLSVPDFYPHLAEQVKSGVGILEAEYQILGTSHAELGAYLLGIWGLPDSVVQAVAFHHTPNKQIDLQFSTLTAVHAANGFLSTTPLGNSQPPAAPQAGQTASYNIDLDYLKAMKCEQKLSRWADIFKQQAQISVSL